MNGRGEGNRYFLMVVSFPLSLPLYLSFLPSFQHYLGQMYNGGCLIISSLQIISITLFRGTEKLVHGEIR